RKRPLRRGDERAQSGRFQAQNRRLFRRESCTVATEDNLAELRERGSHWITVKRGGVKPDQADVAVARDPDAAILAKKQDPFEADLADLHDGLNKPRSVKTYDKVLERLGRLRERYAMVNQHYDITVTKVPDGKACAVKWAPNAAFETRDARAGISVLRTSHTEWDLEKTVRTYWRLTRLEATFESLKSGLGLRPI
ncbi:MAG: hypothetical protein OXC62_07630, partial [Aestuariivita sp.]|nr:hypothetical protein [Aestuariivita sp.]